MEAILRQSRFTIEALPGEAFDGYSIGENWNGWACPYFTFEEAIRIADAHEKILNVKITYKDSDDMFILNPIDEVEEYASILIAGKKLYPMGSFSWIWEEVEP